MGFIKRCTPGAIAAASLLAVGICLLALFAWQAAQPAGATRLIERHQSMSARLDGIMICMLQVEMAHERYLAGGQPEDRSGRDQALSTLGAALRAVDPAVLEETGHAPRFHLLQQHTMRRLPAWLDSAVAAPAPASPSTSARGMLRTGVRVAQAPPGEERLLAARETQVLDTLLAERGQREHSARAALALLAASLLVPALAAVPVLRTRAGRTPHPAAAARLEHEAAIAARERQRISRDMHDDIGQDLYALKLELQRFHAHTRRDHPRLHQDLGRMLGLADDVMANLRSVIDDLRPEGLEHGLAHALQGLADKFRHRTGGACAIDLQIDLQTDPHCAPAALPPASATVLFRILQEALANIRRHAHATRVCVQLARRGDHLCLSVTDNGCGFDPALAAKPGSFGLAGMRERVDACGGMLDIDSAPGRGTALTAALPLARPAPTRG